jgi:glutamate synthase domain-containing protein 1
MKNPFGYPLAEKSSCGVGFSVNLKNEYSHEIIQEALHALRCVEHRGAQGDLKVIYLYKEGNKIQ